MIRVLIFGVIVWFWLSLFFYPVLKYIKIDLYTFFSIIYGISLIVSAVIVSLSEIAEEIKNNHKNHTS